MRVDLLPLQIHLVEQPERFIAEVVRFASIFDSSSEVEEATRHQDDTAKTHA
ncbi:hypothetical protein [Archangium sp.]|uniref:hypothetical protein n=1 Tax=Archangium sp. TaxID=1872627 RepID=UPI002D268F29|nr:hypothetical protein [Archangium sp.]HYO57823.1 hypothetical protein [Archangium sp.]